MNTEQKTKVLTFTKRIDAETFEKRIISRNLFRDFKKPDVGSTIHNPNFSLLLLKIRFAWATQYLT